MTDNVRFINIDLAENKRVRLVPKTDQNTVRNTTGDNFHIYNFQDEGYGFCLGPRTPIKKPVITNVNLEIASGPVIQSVELFLPAQLYAKQYNLAKPNNVDVEAIDLVAPEIHAYIERPPLIYLPNFANISKPKISTCEIEIQEEYKEEPVPKIPEQEATEVSPILEPYSPLYLEYQDEEGMNQGLEGDKILITIYDRSTGKDIETIFTGNGWVLWAETLGEHRDQELDFSIFKNHDFHLSLEFNDSSSVHMNLVDLRNEGRGVRVDKYEGEKITYTHKTNTHNFNEVDLFFNDISWSYESKHQFDASIWCKHFLTMGNASPALFNGSDILVPLLTVKAVSTIKDKATNEVLFSDVSSTPSLSQNGDLSTIMFTLNIPNKPTKPYVLENFEYTIKDNADSIVYSPQIVFDGN